MRFNNFSVSVNDDFLVNSKDNVLIFSGISTPNLSRMLELSNRNCIYMMKDKEVIRKTEQPVGRKYDHQY